MLVAVALPVPVRTAFTYAVPEPLRSAALRGARVRVPFGRRRLTGVVLGPADAAPSGSEVREIEAVLDRAPLLSDPVLDLSLWIAEYYQAPIGEAVRLALPPLAERGGSGASAGRRGSGRGSGDEEFRWSAERGHDDVAGTARAEAAARVVRLAPGKGDAALALDRRARRLRAILDALASGGGPDGWIALAELKRLTGATAANLSSLASRGWIETATVARNPVEPRSTSAAPVAGPVLTTSQAEAAKQILASIDAGEETVYVLRGVTGSGKTEVYFTAARRALDRGRGVIFLVPEISLTAAFTRRVRERFGELVAVIHSRLPERERREAWSRAHDGLAPLIVGPRSALFAPLSRCGLIVVDEEHDPSYKQAETPRYHARDMALVRARLQGAVAILGSATPSVESWHAATTGKFRPLELVERVAGRPLPDVTIVDMREEFRRRGAPVLLSDALRGAIEEARSRGEQSVVLLNRRGYAAFALCRACGEPVGCPRCSVSLVYHRVEERLRCHYCDFSRARPTSCPNCGSEHLVFQGEGTERVERHLERVLPGIRVIRFDKDAVRARGAHERLLDAFEAGEADVLVGTQMVAKGHDFPGVTVVGVLAADAILGFPDFRAAERSFQLLTQVAGRAGRGDRPGRVLVQAYRKDHYALQAAARHDHEAFFQRESRYRRVLGYPPFTNLAALTVRGKDLAATARRARQTAALLAKHGGGRVQVLGPALAPLARLRGVYRVQILLKARARGRLGATLRSTLDALASTTGGTRDLVVDVDPLELL